MTTIEQIRAEIERLRMELSSPDSAPYEEAYKIGAEHTLNSLADFLDTLQGPKNAEDYHKAFDELYGEHIPNLQELDTIELKDRIDEGFTKFMMQKPKVNLENEIENTIDNTFCDMNGIAYLGITEYATVEDMKYIARHFAEWGARHSINWGDVQLLDTFILELSREEKDGADWGDSEKFYTEVLRRFHEFNDKKIPKIVAEWEAEHLKK